MIELVRFGVGTIAGAAFSITAMVATLVWTPIAFGLTRMYQRLVRTEDN